jgi:hypothetical protein
MLDTTRGLDAERALAVVRRHVQEGKQSMPAFEALLK